MALSLLTAVLLLALLAAAHWYLHRRLVGDVLPEGSRWRRPGAVLVSLLAAGTVLLLAVGPAEPSPEVAGPAARVAGAWFPLLTYVVAALLLGELVRPLLRRVLARRDGRTPPGAGPVGAPEGEGETADASRRLFVARSVAIGAAVLATGAAVAGRSDGAAGQGPEAGAVVIAMPFTGLWLARNSPARRVPSHGTDMFGSRYAIDFIGVDEHRRTAGVRDWRTFLATEPPERYLSFGRPVLAPVDGTVVAVHDREPDHEGRRSQLALLPYALGQASRVRRGAGAVAGNHVVISLADSPGGRELYVVLAHLRAGSLRVSAGQRVRTGQHLADCGNSGNSTQPHVHLQLMDHHDHTRANGVPMLFDRFREWRTAPAGQEPAVVKEHALPEEEAVVEPLPRS
ncbi:M23 family metallopeptidase [Streptomyces polyrhachis]|uniref:M23 family metallopeptidase n=1 Tax=Streptomyces polyrhachis TaxID=1282885 RepID=A0ABW2GLR2_9ACTN